MCAQKHRLIETILLSTHYICFGWKIRKLIFNYTLLSSGLELDSLYYSDYHIQPVKHTGLWMLHGFFTLYSKTCVKRPLSERLKIDFQYQLSLNAGQKYCRMLQGEHSALLLTFIKLPFVVKIFVLSIFEWSLYTGFTVWAPKFKSL